ncbi:MAG: hypothetical protein AB8I08_11035 [Sandaracinaceae bacterium]
MTRSFAVCSLVTLVGCSSGYSSGVDGNTPYSAVTAEEAILACENLDAYLQDTIGGDNQLRVNCYVEALSSTIDEVACQAAFDSCLITGPDDPTFELARLNCSNPGVDPTCNADIGDVEVCITDQVLRIEDRFVTLDCTIAGDLSALQAAQEPLGTAASCTALGSTCPNFSDGPF